MRISLDIFVFLLVSKCLVDLQEVQDESPTIRIASEESAKINNNRSTISVDPFQSSVHETSINVSDISENSDGVEVMIRNVNSGLVLDGSDFVVRVAPLVGTYTQLWIFNKSTENPEAIIFTNVANGRALYSWPYTKSVFCYDWADTVYTRWFVEGDRRLVPAAYPQEFLYYGYGPLAISLRYGVSSDGTDEWVLVESKENSET